MKKTGIILLSLFLLAACNNMYKKTLTGNGTPVTITRKTAAYDAVLVNSSFEVELVKGEPGTITLNLDENLADYVEVYVKKGKLHIKLDDDYRLGDFTVLKVVVPVQNLRELAIAGSGKIYAEDGFETPELKISIAGSGSITLPGSVQELEINIAGSGSVHLPDLIARNVAVNIAGSGEVLVHPVDKLEVNIVGSGVVLYNRKPAQIKTHSIGAGKVKYIKS